MLKKYLKKKKKNGQAGKLEIAACHSSEESIVSITSTLYSEYRLIFTINLIFIQSFF